ncbi:MAG: nucleotidyltransferase domain-containing protein [Candidatus ainarchaeum sp.]|jgi:predicted nucleotidyltransferase|nr:nucleotidyltransferase domain-containing protein [Candidatus ainarchaeum sp.]NCP71796.1 hypothetical protein [archaeon]NCP78971.1 hypothetical protein [archaeon]NCP97646.1 hypothetical protein [archaeon]NCQ06738.1 hypothetical protein [archaeon]
MLKEWSQYTGFKVLSYFIENPNTKIHLNELARKLNVSASSVLKYCNSYVKDTVLFKEKKSNSVFFSLNNDNVFVKSFKKSYFIGSILNSSSFSKFIEENKSSLVSLILYGGYSSGNYSENSDVDILIIYNSDKINYNSILNLENVFKKEINITKLSLNQWVKKLNQKDEFITSILNNHVCLWGANINDS